jgi:hypothetical protein
MGLTLNIRSLCSLPGILKIIQIVLGLIAIALLRRYNLEFDQSSILGGGDDYRDRQLTGTIAIGASLLISIPLLVGYVFFDAASSLLEALFCLTACTMNIAGGALAIETYKDMNHKDETVQAGLGMGSMMIINALVYLIDGVTGSIRSSK